MGAFGKIVLRTVLLWAAVQGGVSAEENLKPFHLAWQGPGQLRDKVVEVRQTLSGHGLAVVGEYSPYASSHVFVVTNPGLRQCATKTELGGFGAMQRVSVTQVGSDVQVAYTDPAYMMNAYRMDCDPAVAAEPLAAALGQGKTFGSEEGLSPKKLRNYHYMFGMPYFDEPDTLASYGSHDEAVKTVEAGLGAGRGGVSEVYRIDLPGGRDAVFGVRMTQGCSGDEYIMSRIDFAPLKHTAHLPYEMLVSGNKVLALNARFRIAIDFPDLSMMGQNSFMSIMCAPDAIKEALTAAAGGKT
jgi:hypothetical protein